jgi:hypothetical protein
MNSFAGAWNILQSMQNFMGYLVTIFFSLGKRYHHERINKKYEKLLISWW